MFWQFNEKGIILGNKLVFYSGLFVVLVVIIFLGMKFFSKDSPEKVVEKMFEAFLDQDYEEADSYIDYKDDDEEFGEEFEEIFEEISDYIAEEILEYEDVEEISNNEKKAKVSVEVTAIDYVEVMEKFIKEIESNSDVYYFSEEEFDEYAIETLSEIIMDGDIDTVTNKVTLTLKKNKDGEWKIKDDDELAEIFFGNYNKAMKMFE
jgi:hypothetical protein